MPMTDSSTAPLPSDAHSDLRAEVADQAARLIADGGLDYQSAKQKALRRAFAGTTPPAGLVPTNEEIDRALREHNEQQMADKIIAHLSDGLSVAQVSDAGTPAVCDPGAKLAARVREAGFKVVPVVGASAVMGALSVAGVTESDFYFNGFLPPKAGERQKLLAKWAEADFPIVMFETPHRIEASLADMAAQFPDRRLTLAREITKTFETFLSGTVAEIQAALKNDSNQTRGEMVLVLHPAVKEKHSDLPEAAQNTMKILAAELPTKQAAELAARLPARIKRRCMIWLWNGKSRDNG